MADAGRGGLGDAWAENLESAREYVEGMAADWWLFIDQESAALGSVVADELAAVEGFFLP
jgi:hypothetical protein